MHHIICVIDWLINSTLTKVCDFLTHLIPRYIDIVETLKVEKEKSILTKANMNEQEPML